MRHINANNRQILDMTKCLSEIMVIDLKHLSKSFFFKDSINITFENTYQSVLHVQMVLYRSVCIKFYKCLFGKKTTIKSERKKCIEDDMVNKIKKLLIVDIFVDVSGLFSNRQSNRYRYKIHIITWLFVIAFVWNRRLVKDHNKHCISNIMFLNPRFGWTFFF
jgi:hypothetical protein